MYFFERIRDGSTGQTILSYSDPIEQHMKSDVFRALLGLTLSRMNLATLADPPPTAYTAGGYLSYPAPGPSGGAGPSSGSDRNIGRYDLRPRSGISRGNRYGRTIKRHRIIKALRVSSPKDHITTDMPSRSASWQKTVVKDTGSIIVSYSLSFRGTGLDHV